MPFQFLIDVQAFIHPFSSKLSDIFWYRVALLMSDKDHVDATALDQKMK